MVIIEKVLITGTSNGVGKAAAKKFLSQGYEVIGLDILPATISNDNYTHYTVDVSEKTQLPNIKGINYIVNNAGIVTPKKDAIKVNLYGYMNIIETYGYDSALKSIVNIGSTASVKGYDNLEYNVSQGGRDALTKWAANNFGNDERHVIVNEIRLDGIVAADPSKGIEGTSLEPELYAAEGLMDKIAKLSVLRRLATVENIAEWIYFVAVVNNCMTGQIIDIDGELIGAYQFQTYPGWND